MRYTIPYLLYLLLYCARCAIRDNSGIHIGPGIGKAGGNECQAVWMTEVPQRFQGWSPDEDLKHGKLYLGCLGNQCYYVQFIQICKLLYRVVVYVL